MERMRYIEKSGDILYVRFQYHLDDIAKIKIVNGYRWHPEKSIQVLKNIEYSKPCVKRDKK